MQRKGDGATVPLCWLPAGAGEAGREFEPLKLPRGVGKMEHAELRACPMVPQAAGTFYWEG